MSERFFGTALERGSGVMETTRLCSSIDDEVSEGTCVFRSRLDKYSQEYATSPRPRALTKATG